MPKAERQAIEHEDDIFGFMAQSHISEKNVLRLTVLKESPNERIRHLAAVVLEVAAVKPYKRRRLKFLRCKHPGILAKLRETGLIYAHGDWLPEFEVSDADAGVDESDVIEFDAGDNDPVVPWDEP